LVIRQWRTVDLEVRSLTQFDRKSTEAFAA
jgi:hypothetical protein